MRKEYDFSNAVKNPYYERLSQSITIRIPKSTIEYFKQMGEELDMPYQSLINLYLRDCASKKRKLSMTWRKPTKPRTPK